MWIILFWVLICNSCVEKEVIYASYGSMLNIKLNSQMLGKKDILCIAIKKKIRKMCV
jgi:hypothetical protein